MRRGGGRCCRVRAPAGCWMFGHRVVNQCRYFVGLTSYPSNVFLHDHSFQQLLDGIGFWTHWLEFQRQLPVRQPEKNLKASLIAGPGRSGAAPPCQTTTRCYDETLLARSLPLPPELVSTLQLRLCDFKMATLACCRILIPYSLVFGATTDEDRKVNSTEECVPCPRLSASWCIRKGH